MENQIGIQDILKKSFLESGFNFTLSISDILIVLMASLLAGSFIFYVYRFTFRGVLYSKNYNVSLVAISTVTSVVIMTIGSNLILSLGMVGALSIVRFRNAVKDPLDIAFMFWAISVGIANGAGYFKLTFVSCIFIAILFVLFSKIKDFSSPYLLVIRGSVFDTDVDNKVSSIFSSSKLKSFNQNDSNYERIYEVRLTESSNISELDDIQSVREFSLVSFNGDYVN